MEGNSIMKKTIHILITTILVSAIIGVYFIGEKKLHSENKEINLTSVAKTKVDTTKVENKPATKVAVTEKKLEDASEYNDKPIPILMYHSIAYEKGNDLRIPKEKFREQMKFLKDNGYTTLTLTEVNDLFTKNIPVPKKSVVLTFDDGYVDNYTNAFPILKEFSIKATVFVITDWVDKLPQFMTTAQLNEMDENGIDIEAHTQVHKELDTLSYVEQLKTLKGSKEFLEKNLNKKVNFMAYPFGRYNSTTIKAAKEAGYTVALKMEGGWAKKENGMLTLNRIYIGAKDSIDVFKAKISIPTNK